MSPLLLFLLVLFTPLLLFALYIARINARMTGTPSPAATLLDPASKWTESHIRAAYARYTEHPTDVRPLLGARRGRRYVVCGGSGLVGGWIVAHLLRRGEEGRAIRIVDLARPTQEEVVGKGKGVGWVKADVSDKAQVEEAFAAEWDEDVRSWPLTVFHTVAYIKASERAGDFLGVYERVNVRGTRNVVEAAREAGADVLVATSSGSIGIVVPRFFAKPWKPMYPGEFQVSENGDPVSVRGLESELGECGSCYAWSKMRAEKCVREANGKGGMRTGCIRPGHAIYGHGVDNVSSITWDYLRRRGAPSWIADTVTNLVNAQNVSIAHLDFESRLLSDKADVVAGQAYAVTDPNPPITYGDMYLTLTTLAHSSTPVKFTYVSPGSLLVFATLIEWYILLRHRYLSFLPEVTGDLSLLQPTMFQMCSFHLVYDISRAQKELGYRGAMTTLEGLCLALKDWNDKAEMKVRRPGEKIEPLKEGIVPVFPVGAAR